MSHGQHLPSPAPTPFPGAPPEDPNIHATLEKELQRLAQDLYEMEVCAGDVVAGMEGQVIERMEKVNRSLIELTRLAPQITDSVPKQIIENIDKGKNPHQYTKTSLSRATGENQYALGRLLGLESFRRQLESGISGAFPDLPLPERRHKPTGVENGDGEGRSADTDGVVDGAGEVSGGEVAEVEMRDGTGPGEGMAGVRGEGEEMASGQRKGEETAAEPAGSEVEVETATELDVKQEKETDTGTGAELGESEANGGSKPTI